MVAFFVTCLLVLLMGGYVLLLCVLDGEFDATFIEANSELSKKVGDMVRGDSNWTAQIHLTNGVSFWRHELDNFSGEVVHIYGKDGGVVEIHPVYGYFGTRNVIKFKDKELSQKIRELSEELKDKEVKNIAQHL